MCSDTGIQTEIHRSGVDRSGFGKDSNQILETLAQHTQQAHTHTHIHPHRHIQTEASAFLENLSCTTNNNVFFSIFVLSISENIFSCPWSY